MTLGSISLTVFLCMLFGANAVAIKISLQGLGVFSTLCVRFCIAATVLFCWSRWRGKPLYLQPGKIIHLWILSLIFFVQIAGVYHGQHLTTASHGTLITNVLPFVVMILAHFFLPNDRINLRKVMGLILAFAGVTFLLLDKTGGGTASLKGDLIILAAMLLWGGNVVYIKRIIADYTPLQITLYPMFFSIPLFFIGALVWDEKVIKFLNPEVITAVLYQSLVTASFGFVMWNTLIQKYGATTLHSFIFIIPISGVFFGILLLGEPLTSHLLGAICLVTAGLVLVHYKKTPTTLKPATTEPDITRQ